VDLLLVNTTFPARDPRFLHLGADDAERLIGAVRPRLAVLTHLGMMVLRAGPEQLALGISARTGIPTVAARDGWLLALDPLPRDVPAPPRRGGPRP
jgi:phosphoribosyl 1,2-cyclic phosphodiesterase